MENERLPQTIASITSLHHSRSPHHRPSVSETPVGLRLPLVPINRQGLIENGMSEFIPLVHLQHPSAPITPALPPCTHRHVPPLSQVLPAPLMSSNYLPTCYTHLYLIPTFQARSILCPSNAILYMRAPPPAPRNRNHTHYVPIPAQLLYYSITFVGLPPFPLSQYVGYYDYCHTALRHDIPATVFLLWYFVHRPCGFLLSSWTTLLSIYLWLLPYHSCICSTRCSSIYTQRLSSYSSQR